MNGILLRDYHGLMTAKPLYQATRGLVLSDLGLLKNNTMHLLSGMILRVEKSHKCPDILGVFVSMMVFYR